MDTRLNSTGPAFDVLTTHAMFVLACKLPQIALFAALLAGATLRAAFDLRLVFEHADGKRDLLLLAVTNITCKAAFV